MEEQARDALDELVMSCLDRIEREGPPAIDALCREHPDRAEELRARIETLRDAGLLTEPDAPPERLGDFRLGKRLGGGGMGVVYDAVQESLGRPVALKIVRSDQLYFPGSRERFRREVQLVARLAHAGIVPVFTVGEDDGIPYFAMERLQGATLAEALAMLDGPPTRGQDLADAVARVLEARDGDRVDVSGDLYEGSGVTTSVRIVQRVADALAHAHERGVLHRDLKPSNVMLTADGRALLFDFGLASAPDSASLTKSGSRVGSLAYMAPEQVRGEEVDERGDVYGLGALLCETLTLQPPHVGGPAAVSAAILSGEPCPFRSRRRDLPRDVVTVVETALAPSPERRYESAATMARDLDNVLARRPIEARHAGAIVRATRWIQRHPARAALLALAVVTPLAFAVQQFVARQRVAEQSERAEANLDHAMEAIEDFVWGLGVREMSHLPHFDDSRLGLLENAVDSIEALVVQRPDDAHTLSLAVRLQVALGRVLLERRRLDEAEPRLRAALEIARTSGVDEVMVAPLATLSLLLEKRGRVEDAFDVVAEAVERMESADALWLRRNESTVLRNLSRLHMRLGRPDESRAAADLAIASAERALELAETEAERFNASFLLAGALNRRSVGSSPPAGIHHKSSHDAGAREAYVRALALIRALAEARPERSDVALHAATIYGNAGDYLPASEAEPVLRAAMDLAEALCRDFPERADHARALIRTATNLGTVLVELGRIADAREWFARASDASSPWLERGDEDLDILTIGGLADLNLAMNLVHLERRAEACEPAVRARARIERVLEKLPAESYLHHSLAWCRIQEGYGRLARDEDEVARELADAIPVEELADPTIAVATGELFAGCADLASDPREAEQLGRAALDRLEHGLALGFGQLQYLRTTPEWASLRDDERFVALLSRARE